MNTMMCMPVSMKDAIILPQSVQRSCCSCGEPVWVTPASLDAAMKSECQFMCISCCLPLTDDDVLSPPSSAQLDEVRQALKDGTFDK